MFGQGRNYFDGGICIYVKENIAFRQLNLHLDKETEAIYLEINIRLNNGSLQVYTSPLAKTIPCF